MCLNWLQRFLSKPWRYFYKFNSGNDRSNKNARDNWEWVKVPLYIILTPLRFVNAVYFNIFTHCSFELFNYIFEVVSPSKRKEGAGSFIGWLIWLPVRFVWYLVIHGLLTLIESVIWTVVDTFVPSLTLWHGTSPAAAINITQSPDRTDSSNWKTGIWDVGSGNYVGNGIYFAPARSTALHYGSGALIVCRVTLGKVLDLGMAPTWVFKQCGHPNAHGATQWGLDNGYTTGEWWRNDVIHNCFWWEYCMFDWKNRYNHSWRIRPLYVINRDKEIIQTIPGGMAHWLFRKMVVNDLITYFKQYL